MFCECGCGHATSIAPQSSTRLGWKKGEHVRFIRGHYKPLTPPWPRGVWRKPESRNRNTGRHRAKRLKPRDACELASIGGCLGRLEVHHKDKDPANNADDNLMTLCLAHHQLVDHGRIDLAWPVMPPFYTDGSGKRRYLRPVDPVAEARRLEYSRRYREAHREELSEKQRSRYRRRREPQLALALG